MSKIIKDDDGNELEVFTAEELEAQKVEAIEKYKEENPDISTEMQAKLDKYEEDLRLAQEQLEKAGDKGTNIANLRKAKEDAEKKLQEFEKGLGSKIEQVKNEILEGVNKDHYNDTMKMLAGNDKELEKKIEFNYKRLGGGSGTKADITAKLNEAYLLSTGVPADSGASSAFSSGGANRIRSTSAGPKLSAEEQALATRMAAAGGMKLEPKDFEKK